MIEKTNLATLGIKVDAIESIESMNSLALAVERVNKVLDELSEKQFDRINIYVVGQMAKAEVVSASTIVKDGINPERNVA